MNSPDNPTFSDRSCDGLGVTTLKELTGSDFEVNHPGEVIPFMRLCTELREADEAALSTDSIGCEPAQP